MSNVLVKRGVLANIPSTGLVAGTMYFTTDANTLHIATGATTKVAIVPAVSELDAIGTIDTASDLLLIEDNSATGKKARKVTIENLKASLNIPAASSDEKVSVNSGGTAGYIWGTDGTDGILRVTSQLALTKDSGNAFVTFDVGTIDCGTF